jgi:hypothetical protein
VDRRTVSSDRIEQAATHLRATEIVDTVNWVVGAHL